MYYTRLCSGSEKDHIYVLNHLICLGWMASDNINDVMDLLAVVVVYYR